MSFLKGLSIGAKLLVLPGLFVLALLVVSGMAYYGLAKQQAVIEEIDQLRFQQYRQVLETSAASQAAMKASHSWRWRRCTSDTRNGPPAPCNSSAPRSWSSMRLK
mgnify:CR=1 FL=1